MNEIGLDFEVTSMSTVLNLILFVVAMGRASSATVRDGISSLAGFRIATNWNQRRVCTGYLYIRFRYGCDISPYRPETLKYGRSEEHKRIG